MVEFFVYYNQNGIKVELKTNDTVANLQVIIRDRLGIPIENQIFLYTITNLYDEDEGKSKKSYDNF